MDLDELAIRTHEIDPNRPHHHLEAVTRLR